MFIAGLGNIVGIGPMTKLCVSGSVVRVRDLDDQHLSLLIPAVLRGDPTTSAVPRSDNRLIDFKPYLIYYPISTQDMGD